MSPISRLLTIRAELTDEAAAAEVSPETLGAAAERWGWERVGETGEHLTYRKAGGELHVPLCGGWDGYGRRVIRELQELAEVEGRPTLQLWAELVGIGQQRPQVATRAAIGASDGLPGIEAPAKRRRATRHAFGPFQLWKGEVGPLAPAAEVELYARACRYCSCLHRVASAGKRRGAVDLYSSDNGATWGAVSPKCRTKA